MLVSQNPFSLTSRILVCNHLNVAVLRILFSHWCFYHVYGRRFIFINNHNKKWLTADTYNNMDGWLVIIVEVLVVSTEG